MNGPSRVERLGTEKIGKLLLEMSSQTTLSLLVYAIYSVTDTYFLSVGINSLAAAGASIIYAQHPHYRRDIKNITKHSR
jgi:hypothetical protein